MDVRFIFKEIVDNDEIAWKHGGWIGRYTVGHINWRGTRVWFRPPYVKSFDNFHPKDVDSCRDKLSKGEVIFPGDCCNLRGDCLEEILCELKGEVDETEKCRYYNGTIQRLLKEKAPYIANDNFKQELQTETFQFDEILIDAEANALCNVWLMTQKDDIIAELDYVLDRCDDEEVLWIWV